LLRNVVNGKLFEDCGVALLKANISVSGNCGVFLAEEALK
jgi:hypothetical protein